MRKQGNVNIVTGTVPAARLSPTAFNVTSDLTSSKACVELPVAPGTWAYNSFLCYYYYIFLPHHPTPSSYSIPLHHPSTPSLYTIPLLHPSTSTPSLYTIPLYHPSIPSSHPILLHHLPMPSYPPMPSHCCTYFYARRSYPPFIPTPFPILSSVSCFISLASPQALSFPMCCLVFYTFLIFISGNTETRTRGTALHAQIHIAMSVRRRCV